MKSLKFIVSATMALLLSVLVLASTTGCQTGGLLTPKPRIETVADRVITEAIAPALQQGLKQGVENLTIQAGAQGINPTYRFTAAGRLVQAVEVEGTVGVEGVAGQMQLSSTSTDKTARSPYQLTPATSPPAGETQTPKVDPHSAAPVGQPAEASAALIPESQPAAADPEGGAP